MIRIATSGLVWFLLTLTGYLVFAFLFPTEPLYEVINIMLGASCLFLVFCGTRTPYSLLQVFALACFVLLALVPRMEMSLGIAYWGGSTSVLKFYPLVSFLSLLSVWLFWACWQMGQKALTQPVKRISANVSGRAALFISGIAVAIIYAYNGFSFVNVLFRGGGGEIERAALSQTTRLIYSNFLFPIPSIVLVLYLLGGRGSRLVLVGLFLLVLFGNPPTGMARWQAAMLYLAIFVSFTPRVASRRYLIAWLLFAGLFVLFPVLDLFRRFAIDFQFSFSLGWIFQGHFDSMQNFARAVENDFVTWGRQLLGALGFFIPRAIWPTKPIGSGAELAEAANLGFNNIGMNFLGEGYINFGVIGVLLFSGVLGAFFGRLDARYWIGKYRGRSTQAIYLFLLGGTFFMVRGDLMSSFAYLTGTSASVLAMRSLLTLKFSRRDPMRSRRPREQAQNNSYMRV